MKYLIEIKEMYIDNSKNYKINFSYHFLYMHFIKYIKKKMIHIHLFKKKTIQINNKIKYFNY